MCPVPDGGTTVASWERMLLRAQPIQVMDEQDEPEVHRRVDDDMLEDGVAMQTAWAWALFAVGVAVAIGLFFVYTPR